MAISEIIGGDTKYFKIRAEGTDKWYIGKVTASKIPSGSTPITFKEYFKIRFGELLYQYYKRQVDLVSKHNRGELVIEEADYMNLPNPNDEKQLKEILNKTKQVN